MADAPRTKFSVLALHEVLDEGHENEVIHRGEDPVMKNIVFCLLSKLHEKNDRVRTPNWAEIVVPNFLPDDFRLHFRMDKSSVEKLRSIVMESEFLIQKQTGGSDPIDLTKQILLYLWFSSSQETFRSVADRFDVTKSSVHRTITRIANAINDKLDNIKWPTKSYRHRVVQGFREFNGIDGVIGAIDGTHIPISAPKLYGENYINRKGYTSLILQCVCDHEMQFTDCYTGWPGSVHDSRVFANSTLSQKIAADIFEMMPDGTFMLGDAAYKLEAFMMTPYKNNGSLTDAQEYYNYYYCQSSSRIVIERSFGVMKSHFPRLKKLEMQDFDRMVMFIISTFVFRKMKNTDTDTTLL